MRRSLLLPLALLLALGCGDDDEPDAPLPAPDTAASTDPGPPPPDADPIPAPPAKQILFGDLHVHSTFSTDAYVLSTPLLSGRGIVGPELHCDFARFCSQLDFWAITDHPEATVPELWADTREAIRNCNALEGGLTDDPDMVSFTGWEWTQSANDPSAVYGHKNVIFRDTADADLPARTIAAATQVTLFTASDVDLLVGLATALDPANADIYAAFGDSVIGGLEAPLCPDGVDVHALPIDCREEAIDPATLYEKLDQWGFDALVIPHGTAWGAHLPPLAIWSNQLTRAQHNPDYERLVEVYSAHGAMEVYRELRAVEVLPDGTQACPKPTDAYEPCCYRAGEIIRGRSEACKAEPEGPACAEEVAAAVQAYLDAGRDGPTTIVGVRGEDWLDCGQCRDCFQAARTYRPLMTAQTALALTDFEKPDDPFRYHLGFIGSTDSHRAGPGAGYKEAREMSDNYGASAPEFDALVEGTVPVLFPEWERQNSYFYSGGLVAAHSLGRSRGAIWDALQRREVYATSGERILLWFDLVGADGERVPMGGKATPGGAPTFEVRAVGAFEQAPGCAADILAEAPDGFIESACFGQCYHPTDDRHVITRVEIVKITPQTSPQEALGPLIEDPVYAVDCPPDPEGCQVTWTDEAFVAGARPATYYARVLQEPTQQFNAANLRCETDDQGRCIATNLCPGGYHGADDDCMALDNERAWSSPIYLTPPGANPPAP